MTAYNLWLQSSQHQSILITIENRTKLGRMSQAVFHHKPNSIYDDDPARKYHFPKSYLSRVRKTLNDWIVYYGPIEGKKGRFYSAVARTSHIEVDPEKSDHYYVFLTDYIDFDRPLHYAENGGYEKKLFKENGLPNGGYTQQSVRHLDVSEFREIVEAGLSEEDEWPTRTDTRPEDRHEPPGLGEVGQSPISGMFVERPIMQQIIDRPFREAKFRQHIRRLYDRTCAFSSLRLINGKGRPEVEAAHIVPVESGGNDSVQNGIALAGTVHWMFDRGLLSLTDDFQILASRHLNYDISHLLNADMKATVPEDKSKRPHPAYLSWHRSERFKG